MYNVTRFLHNDEAFINQLKKMGVDEYLKLYQGLYDRFQAALK